MALFLLDPVYLQCEFYCTIDFLYTIDVCIACPFSFQQISINNVGISSRVLWERGNCHACCVLNAIVTAKEARLRTVCLTVLILRPEILRAYSCACMFSFESIESAYRDYYRATLGLIRFSLISYFKPFSLIPVYIPQQTTKRINFSTRELVERTTIAAILSNKVL